MKEPRWIEFDEVIFIHQEVIREFGGILGMRAGGRELVESALARPRQRFAYDSTATLPELAASYLIGLIKNHGFLDGNKRVAFAIAATFLERSGPELRASEAEAYQAVMAAAESRLTEGELALWLKKESRRMRRKP